MSAERIVHPQINPYIGPRAFEVGEKIYGRENEASKLFNLLISERIVLLHSPSGAGKTSLIQAELIPRLHDLSFDVLPIARVNKISPEGSKYPPTSNRYVYSVLYDFDSNLPSKAQVSAERLGRLEIAEYLNRRRVEESNDSKQILIFDQFEEILTLDTTDLDVKDGFFRQLGEALGNADRWALFAIREEYVAALDRFRLSIPTFFDNTFRLELLKRSAAVRAVQQPASAAGVKFTDSAVHKLVDDLSRVQLQQADGSLLAHSGPYVEPVQLQVVCHRLWEMPRSNPQEIKSSDLKESVLANQSLVDQSLSEYYAKRVANVAINTEVSERKIREWFDKRLLTRDGVRRPVLREVEESSGLENRAIQGLVDAHLIRAELQRGSTWFELSHDRLVHPLRSDNRIWFQSRLNLLQRQASQWQESGRPESLLLRANEFRTAKEWAGEHRYELLPHESEFLEACQSQFDRELRFAWLSRFILILGILSIVLGAVAYRNLLVAEDQREHALDQLLLAKTQQIDTRESKNAGLRLALAIEAFGQLQNAESYQTLWTSRYHFRPTDVHLITGSEAVVSICFSPDNALLVSANAQGLIQIWNTESGTISKDFAVEGSTIEVICNPVNKNFVIAVQDEVTATLSAWDFDSITKLWEGSANLSITDIVFSHDGELVISGTQDGPLAIWNGKTGKLEGVDPRHSDIVSIAVSPIGKQIATANLAGTIVVAPISDGEVTFRAETSSTDLRLMYSPDGKKIVSGGADGKITFWDSNSGQPLGIIDQDSRILSLTFSPDGRRLFSSADDDKGKIWDSITHDEVAQFTAYGPIYSASFDPTGDYIVAGGFSGYSTLRDLTELDARGNLLAIEVMSIANDEQVVDLSFSPNGKLVATATSAGTITLTEFKVRLFKQRDHVWHVEFSNDDQFLITASRGGTAKVWNLTTNQNLLTVSHQNGSWINHASFSASDKLLATAGSDGRAHVWILADGTRKTTIVHNDVVSHARFGLGGKLLITASWDGTAKVADINTGRLLFEIVHQKKINDLILSSDESMAITASEDQMIRIWDLTTKSEIHKLVHNYPITKVAISPDKSLLISGDQAGGIVFWDLQSGESAYSGEMSSGSVHSIAFNQAGTQIAAGNSLGEVCVWDIESKSKSFCFFTGKDVWDLHFSFSELLFAASGDGHVHIWDTGTAAEYGKIPFPGLVLTLDLSSDEKLLATGTSAGTSHAEIWRREEILADACSSLPRQLTESEWEDYLGTEKFSPFCLQ